MTKKKTRKRIEKNVNDFFHSHLLKSDGNINETVGVEAAAADVCAIMQITEEEEEKRRTGKKVICRFHLNEYEWKKNISFVWNRFGRSSSIKKSGNRIFLLFSQKEMTNRNQSIRITIKITFFSYFLLSSLTISFELFFQKRWEITVIFFKRKSELNENVSPRWVCMCVWVCVCV